MFRANPAQLGTQPPLKGPFRAAPLKVRFHRHLLCKTSPVHSLGRTVRPPLLQPQYAPQRGRCQWGELDNREPSYTVRVGGRSCLGIRCLAATLPVARTATVGWRGDHLN